MNRRVATFGLTGLLLVAMVLSQGCASIVSKSDYPVNITSEPSNAAVTVSNKKGEEVFTGMTPTTVTLKAGAGYFSGQDYTVTLEKDGYPARTAKIKRGFDGWYLGGNIVFGGLIGWLVVDPLTGAMWKLEDLHVDLSADTQARAPDPTGYKIVSLDSVPRHLRSSMVRIN